MMRQLPLWETPGVHWRPVYLAGEKLGEAMGWFGVLTILTSRGIPGRERASMVINGRATPEAFFIGPVVKEIAR